MWQVGGLHIVKKTKRWVGKALTKSTYWPVSPGIAHTLIEGIVVNRGTYRCIVNAPTNMELGTMIGNISRLYRTVFGIPLQTPREALYNILQINRPDVRIWATVASELYKAQPPPNVLLRDVARHHGGTSASHKYDQDVVRLKKTFLESGMLLGRGGLIG